MANEEVEPPMTASVVAVALVRMTLVPKKVDANILVAVACDVVLRRRFGRKRRVPMVSVALIRASARAGVKYRLEPSVTLVVSMPSDEVAIWSQVLPVPPMRSDEDAMVLSPVPPPCAWRVPASVLAKVMVLPAAVMVVDAVSPWYAVLEVAKVMAGPAWRLPTGPIEVTAVVRPWVRQVPFMA